MCASCGPLVIIQETTESWTPTNPTLAFIEHHSFDQLIAQPLMIAFVMIVHDVLGHGLLEVPLMSQTWAEGGLWPHQFVTPPARSNSASHQVADAA